MFHTIFPLTLVALSIIIFHDAVSLSFIFFVLSFIWITIGPAVFSFTMFFIVFPLTFIALTIITEHGSFALESVRYEKSFKNAAFLHQNAFSMSSII